MPPAPIRELRDLTRYRKVLIQGRTRHANRPDNYDRRHAERLRRRALQTLERQGYRVTLEPAA